ncbi:MULTISPECIES: MmcQ/YjbR family DNA-binding protein [unclassified Enterococcus]|uniref:MmcQ/YjbR family DNA-binding protein n=1 Tax=unclassified Enterococcus TaxID=2608891 RepID=UPI0015576FDA|nr:MULTISPECIES: MmcQ/YjbR family DNA-binding protein [unclassified Enterococcus]MBS7577248.1 MmcQ/YjbR family DNA-binding protein [Enterococcus sp. MMGLQ5-2]MBS7584659.1 MmcQ/YjbR family DNA-binding protein [Enterococcus sp. MMGLQ5-1]NPD12514.1 MmcQ/YjbR family DNA-binding protein [Enterococcus sp. MMGLQ5-1]NPD37082.1 MmcQ/YjbR family DNA-binding protein [Enterococcus sp. MMGLQ5-2]
MENDELLNYAKQLTASEVYWYQQWECYRFDIGGKIFGYLNERYLTLKNTPEKNERLREQFSAIIAGYYMNKTHWNSVLMQENTELGLPELEQLILESYQLVVSKLSKKERQRLGV